MFRPALLAVTLVTAGFASAGLALAATSPASDDHRAQAPISPDRHVADGPAPAVVSTSSTTTQALRRRPALAR